MKRLLSLALILTLLATFAVGCSPKADTDTSSAVNAGEGTVSSVDDGEESSTVTDTASADDGNNNGDTNIDTNSKGNASKPNSAANVANVNKTGFPIVNKKITLDVMILKPATHSDYSSMTFTKKYEEMTNIKINWQVVAEADMYSKKTLTLASRDYPDLILLANSVTSADVVKYGTAGVLQSIGDQIKTYAPNLQKVIDSNKEVKRALTAPDGKIYSIPNVTTRNTADLFASKVYVNADWLKALNLKKPTNYTELLTVLRAFKNNDPNKNGKKDEIPLVIDMFNPGVTACPQGLHWTWEDDCMGIDKSGKISFTFGSEQFLESLRFLRTLADESLMDERVFKGDLSMQAVTNTANDNVGMFIMQHGTTGLPESKLEKYEVCQPIQGNTGTAVTQTKLKGQIEPFWGVIPVSNQNVEATLRWLDYFYTVDGFIFKEYGPSGSNVLKKMPTGKYQVVSRNVSDKYKVAPGWVLPGLNSAEANAMFMEKATTTVLDTWYQKVDVKQCIPMYEKYIPEKYIPTLYFSLAEANKMQSLRDGLIGYAKTTSMNFIYRSGELNLDTGWNTYIAELKKLGMDEMVGYYQKAYNNYTKNS